MSDKVTIVVDGREITTDAGTTVLEAAREANIHIPTLCHNEELNPYGACRLCMVEITLKKRTRLVTSCIYEAVDGLEVKTNSERVLKVRRLVIELLMIRNPTHPTLLELARKLDIEKTRFEIDMKGCILCGMCVRTCREVVGVAALGYKGRGITREVTTPFDGSPPDCIACGSCAYVCPVGVIPMREKDGVRRIWKTDFPLQKCDSCGRYFEPVKQLEYYKVNFKMPDSHINTCVHCR